MPKLPMHNYTVPALEEEKLYAVTYVYETGEGWFGDTWNIKAKCIGDALSQADDWLASFVNQSNYATYEIVGITVIRKGV